MTDINFEQEMTSEQVQLAQEAGKLAHDHVQGVRLYEGLKIGESLLVGRDVAMRLAHVNAPIGRAYADHLLRWKMRFGFPTDPAFNSFCDAAIYCAQNRSIADEVIASLPVKRRAELGIQGLVKRVRERVREARGEPRKPPKPSPVATLKQKLSDAEGELADAKERLAATDEGSLFDLRKDTAEEIAEIILKHLHLARTRGIRNALTKVIKREEEAIHNKPKPAG